MPVRFSKRTAWDTGESTLAEAVRQVRSSGRSLIDLTLSNPTLCGFEYDSAAILGALTNPAAMTYDPDPRGLTSARRAVSQYYADNNALVDPAQILLTTSTSEAYSSFFGCFAIPVTRCWSRSRAIRSSTSSPTWTT